MSHPIFLPLSDKFDSVLCLSVHDIDFDDTPEVILGTYGQQMLCYKKVGDTFSLIAKRKFAKPIMSFCWLDISNCGLEDLIVTTLNGVHFGQVNADIALERLASVASALEQQSEQRLTLQLP